METAYNFAREATNRPDLQMSMLKVLCRMPMPKQKEQFYRKELEKISQIQAAGNAEKK